MPEDGRLISLSHSDRNGRRGLRVVASSDLVDATSLFGLRCRAGQSALGIAESTVGALGRYLQVSTDRK
jgi:hypothetical protein